MLSESDRQIAHEFKKRLQAIFEIIDFRVYGSRARGDNSEESDLDVFIELNTISPAVRLRISELAWEIGFDYDRVISTFVTTPDNLINGPLSANPILKKIAQEGIRI